MKDIPARAKRAGAKIKQLTSVAKGAVYDIVLCDAPCSGSGAWRRAPDGKWRLTRTRLQELMSLQDKILDTAAAHVAGQGILAYATCSLMACENEDRIAAFLGRHSDWKQRNHWHWRPDSGTDGFFTAHFTRK